MLASGMAQVAEQLVGRDAELTSLDHALAELEQGRPVALELAGEPGIGKTRLLAELASRADARGWLVLAGSASELEDELPFWVFVDALDEYVHGLEPRQLDSMDDDARAELAHVLPSMGDAAPLPPERYRTHRAIRQLLEALARARPLVLVLDDLHWADQASIELLGSLLRRPPAGVLLALAMRPRQRPERLQGPLERARGAGTLTRLELGALTADEARRLLGGAVSDELFEESHGNPFYLQQLARFPDARTVSAALAEELALLREEVRRVLEGAAVAGDPFEPERAAAAAGVPEAAALEALDELLRLDLVRPGDVPRRFRFRHPLVRSAVYETAPAAWRLGAHERAAEALAAQGAPPLERAPHVERSARRGDAEAAAVLRAAGEATMLRAPSIAARWFAAALRILPADGDRIELLTSLAGANEAAGRFREAYDAILEALELAPAEMRIGLIARAAGLEQVLGDHERAHARLAAAIDDIPDRRVDRGRRGDDRAVARSDLRRRVRVDARLGDAGVRRREVTRRPAADAVVGVADGTGERVPGRRARGRGRLRRGGGGDGGDERRRAGGRLEAPPYLAAAEYYLDRLDEAGAHAERAIAVGRATGHGDLFLVAYAIVGNIRLARGDIAGATEFFDAAVEITRLSDNAQLLGWNLVNRSMVATAAGDTETALATAEEVTELAESLHGVAAAWSRVAHAAALLASG